MSGSLPTPTQPPLVSVRKLRRVFGHGDAATAALESVDLDIAIGEMTALTGPSGSGKSTLMAILGCLDRPTSGSYQLLGEDVTRLSDDELSALRNRTIGFVFQSFNLLQRSTAIENVELPQVYAGVSRGTRRKHAIALLESMNLGHRLNHRPNALSGGEMQRVAIARALVNAPRLILADEPTGNLDSRSGQEILRIFHQMNRERGVTLVIVTHDPGVAAQCRRVVELHDGRLVGDHEVTT